MAALDLKRDSDLIQQDARAMLDAAERKIDIVNGYARPIAARTAVRIFGVDGPSETELMRVARAVFQETFLNLNNAADVRQRGRDAGVHDSGSAGGFL